PSEHRPNEANHLFPRATRVAPALRLTRVRHRRESPDFEGGTLMRRRISVIVAAALLVVIGLLSHGVSAADDVIKHIVPPYDTDPALEKVPEHYAWLDPAVRPRRKLLVFLPGTATSPSACQLLQREAAQLGYHVVGLMYQNTVALATICPSAANPDACFEN